MRRVPAEASRVLREGRQADADIESGSVRELWGPVCPTGGAAVWEMHGEAGESAAVGTDQGGRMKYQPFGHIAISHEPICTESWWARQDVQQDRAAFERVAAERIAAMKRTRFGQNGMMRNHGTVELSK
jgi:hypothetical protein